MHPSESQDTQACVSPAYGKSEISKAMHNVRGIVENINLNFATHKAVQNNLRTVESLASTNEYLEARIDALHRDLREHQRGSDRQAKKYHEMQAAFLNPELSPDKLRGMLNLYFGFTPDFDMEAARIKARASKGEGQDGPWCRESDVKAPAHGLIS